MAEYDALVQQREIVRQQEQALEKQGTELDRKIDGLRQSLQGLSLYTTAKNQPPDLMKVIPGISDSIRLISGVALDDITKPKVTPKTLTECCRDILMRSGEWLAALQVRQSLHAAGFDFSEYKSNPLSSIHITLKRIVEAGQAWSRTDSKNETLYKWRLKGETGPPPIESIPAPKVDILFSSKGPISPPPDFGKKKKK